MIKNLALRNYINAGLIELSATQIFNEAFTQEIFSKIYDINKDKTITTVIYQILRKGLKILAILVFLGYVGIDNQGLSGLELQYDKYLTGKSGAIKYFSDAKGNRLERSEVYVEPQNGINLTLTIDLDISNAIFLILKSA